VWVADELHGNGTEPPQGFKGDRVEQVFPTGLVCRVVPALVSVLRAVAWPEEQAAERMYEAASGWMNETPDSTWLGPGRKLQWKSQSAWGWLGVQAARREYIPSRLEEKQFFAYVQGKS
jgi:hypothetical protein